MDLYSSANDPTTRIPVAKEPKSGVTVPTLALVALVVFMVICFIAFVASEYQYGVLSASKTRTVVGPTHTITVVKDVPSGITPDQFDACASQFTAANQLLGDQTTMLKNVSQSASDALTAVQNGDTAGLYAAGAAVQGYTPQEVSISAQINALNPSACSR